MNACRVAALLGPLACILALAPTPAHAQPAAPYPERTVRIIVPFPAGGATDILARLLAERMNGAWHRPVIIENVAGAAGGTGTAQAAKAPADGHTLLVATGTTTTLLPHLRRSLPYDPRRDFDAVALICSFPNMLVIRPGVPAMTVQELIDLARANPGKLSYASSGYGASPHIAAEWFKFITGTDILHVPFTGSAPALPALLGGHLDMMFDTMPSVWPLVQEGRLRALGVTTFERVPFLPDIPAVAETLPEFDVTSWLGIMVPAGTAAGIRSKIAGEIANFLQDATTVQRLKELGAVAAKPNSPQDFAAVIAKDFTKWERVIRDTGIRLGE